MLLIGPISSIFDFVTFFVLLKLPHSSPQIFHTGWFVESLATQTLVLFVIRTAGRPWSNLPSVPLAVTTLLIVLIGTALPFLPVARDLGLVPLPPIYFVFLASAVVAYLALVELVKRRLLESFLAQRGSGEAQNFSTGQAQLSELVG
jgi:Mg2+-importing ATPase